MSRAGRVPRKPGGVQRVQHENRRRAAVDVEANVTEQLPLVWTGKKMSRADAARRFAFARTLQLLHRDGLTCDYLYKIAADLAAQDAVVLLGAGKNGKEPVVLQVNGSPYRAFLEGRVKGESYKLLLHLSTLPLQRPQS